MLPRGHESASAEGNRNPGRGIDTPWRPVTLTKKLARRVYPCGGLPEVARSRRIPPIGRRPHESSSSPPPRKSPAPTTEREQHGRRPAASGERIRCVQPPARPRPRLTESSWKRPEPHHSVQAGIPPMMHPPATTCAANQNAGFPVSRGRVQVQRARMPPPGDAHHRSAELVHEGTPHMMAPMASTRIDDHRWPAARARSRGTALFIQGSAASFSIRLAAWNRLSATTARSAVVACAGPKSLAKRDRRAELDSAENDSRCVSRGMDSPGEALGRFRTASVSSDPSRANPGANRLGQFRHSEMPITRSGAGLRRRTSQGHP